jgi:hypothetical protein
MFVTAMLMKRVVTYTGVKTTIMIAHSDSFANKFKAFNGRVKVTMGLVDSLNQLVKLVRGSSKNIVRIKSFQLLDESGWCNNTWYRGTLLSFFLGQVIVSEVAVYFFEVCLLEWVRAVKRNITGSADKETELRVKLDLKGLDVFHHFHVARLAE